MKNLKLLIAISAFTLGMTSCTEEAMVQDGTQQELATGGESSSQPDNDKDKDGD